MRTVVRADPNALAREVAAAIAEISRAPNAEKRYVALSGGSTPKRLYEALASPPFLDVVHWRRLEFFFGDERAVPADHPDSNYAMARSALLARIPSTAHRMAAEAGDAEGYERLIRSRVHETRNGVPIFDLVLLGLGADGHTASLFPRTEALDEQQRLVVMNFVPQLETRRMTFTYTLINAARRVWILVAGADKREIVRRCLGDANGYGELPVRGIQPHDGELVWWLDQAAAPA